MDHQQYPVLMNGQLLQYHHDADDAVVVHVERHDSNVMMNLVVVVVVAVNGISW